MSRGIVAAGAYIPRLRLPRAAIADFHRWMNPAASSKGERAAANWDEDVVTMAVEAARDALAGHDRGGIGALRFASTTFPFLDRLNAAIVAEALSLPEEIDALDVASSQRCGIGALRAAHTSGDSTLVLAAEKRRTRAASPLESTSGDGAVAFLVGEGEPLARLLASATRTVDFVDHYRTAESDYDYAWEERWVRDAGYLDLVPPVVASCLERAGLKAADVAHFCLPSPLPRVAESVAKACGFAPAAVADSLALTVGDTGAAHPLLMFAAALERASPGERILVVGFGQGVDALLYEVTAQAASRGRGVAAHVAERSELSYAKFLAFNDTITLERGMRAEVDKLTPLSALWRNREAVTGFKGGECRQCGTRQFPRSRVCVNPNCNAVDSQTPCDFADAAGRIRSHTADRLTFSLDPPACYGMIEFEGGGRWMMDFADIAAEDLEVGQAVRMVFRIKDIDTQRGFRRYFWKAAPAFGSERG